MQFFAGLKPVAASMPLRFPVSLRAFTAAPPSSISQRRAFHPPLSRTRVPPRSRRRRSFRVSAAAFDNLSRSLERAWESVRRDGKLNADNIKTPMREIRRALLEADVSLPVVRRFVSRVEQAALGAKVTKGVTPEQQLVKVVYDQLQELMGGSQAQLVVPAGGDPQVVLMAGLQGTGKTTAAGKLALWLKNKGQKVLLVATDVYRPAAIDQLVTLGQRIGVPVFELGTSVAPPEIASQGVAKAIEEGFDVVIVDTAGRLQIDADMMSELQSVKSKVAPTDVLLVVDAMTGQEAAALVKAFDEAVSITGAVLTKTDGDSRGGAALSVKEVSGRPIKFVGTGEKLEDLEPFYPDRMASRILGMGDVVTLVERAEQAIKEEEATEVAKRLMTAKFDFNDFMKQYKMVTGLGSLGQVAKLIPGMNKVTDKQMEKLERQYMRYEAMITSMTKREREEPELLAKSPSRRRRVARGSGHDEQDVAELVAVFTGMRSQMQGLSRVMALSGGGMNIPGMPTMSDEEMMATVLGGTGPRKVAPGKVRRKRKSAGAVSAASNGIGAVGDKGQAVPASQV